MIMFPPTPVIPESTLHTGGSIALPFQLARTSINVLPTYHDAQPQTPLQATI